MANKPGVVLVPGAEHSPWHFSNVIAELESNGYTVEAPALPSVSPTVIEDSMPKSIDAIKQAIYKITRTGRNVVMMMHSFGGVSGSEAVAEFHEETKSINNPQHGRIIQLVYIAAIIIEKGTMWAGQLKGPDCTFEDGLLRVVDPIPTFYNTMDPALAQQCVEKLQPQSLNSVTWIAKYRGWVEYGVPVTYIACDRDNCMTKERHIPLFFKRFEDGGLKDFKVERIDCDHTPWLGKGRDDFFRFMWDILDKASSE